VWELHESIPGTRHAGCVQGMPGTRVCPWAWAGARVARVGRARVCVRGCLSPGVGACAHMHVRTTIIRINVYTLKQPEIITDELIYICCLYMQG